MNGSRSMAGEFVKGLADRVPVGCQVMLIPPFVFLDQVGRLLADRLAGSMIRLGAQDVDYRPDGAVTGAISAGMLADVGCTSVLVGHSERRTLFGESSSTVAAKFEAAVAAGVQPVLCVGETVDERDRDETLDVITAQLDAVIERVGATGFENAVIAYEPVWAIGTGKTATPEQAQQVHAAIRDWLSGHDESLAQRTLLLYGGSVKADNAGELLKMPDIDGALVGGASLKSDEFASICETAAAMDAAAG